MLSKRLESSGGRQNSFVWDKHLFENSLKINKIAMLDVELRSLPYPQRLSFDVCTKHKKSSVRLLINFHFSIAATWCAWCEYFITNITRERRESIKPSSSGVERSNFLSKFQSAIDAGSLKLNEFPIPSKQRNSSLAGGHDGVSACSGAGSIWCAGFKSRLVGTWKYCVEALWSWMFY